MRKLERKLGREQNSRFGINLIQKATTILLIKYTSESPRLILHGLHILNLNNKHITRLSILNLKGTGQVMDLCEVDILHVVGIVGVFDLTACPVDAFDLYSLAVGDFARKGDVWVPAVVQLGLRGGFLVNVHAGCVTDLGFAHCGLGNWRMFYEFGLGENRADWHGSGSENEGDTAR